MTARVRLLGRPVVETGGRSPGSLTSAPAGPPTDAQAAVGQPRGRKSWALLARLALADRPLSRTELATEMFAEAEDPLASLRWSLAELRRRLGSELLRGDPLRLVRGEIDCDVWDLEDGDASIPSSTGTLLAGIDLRDSPGFDLWLTLARSRVDAMVRQELRSRTLRLLTSGDHRAAIDTAHRAVEGDPLDEAAQELLLRCLSAAGQLDLARRQLAACEELFRREGLQVSPALRAAAGDRHDRPLVGLRAGVAAKSLLRAAAAALDAGAADGGIETLRRAADDAERAGDPALQAEVLLALGAALVHSVRGFDGEGAVVLHRALSAAGSAGPLVAEIHRELAFVDVQAGRHLTAARSLRAAAGAAAALGDAGLDASLSAVDGMNQADVGRHTDASSVLARSAGEAERGNRPRQQVWSLGVMARSLLLGGRVDDARQAAEASLAGADRHRFTAFVPWPQVIRAQCLAVAGDTRLARSEAEAAFALGCELGDPCWEGMAARALGMMRFRSGDPDRAWSWLLEAQQRCDRVSDRYVWVSAYIGLAQLEVATVLDPGLVPGLADRLQRDATRADLPEFVAWALAHRVAAGDRPALPLARGAAAGVQNPRLHTRIAGLDDLRS